MTMHDFILRLNPTFTDEDKKRCIPTITKLVRIANIARINGVRVLESEAKEEDSFFMQTALGLIVDGRDPEIVIDILQHLILADKRDGFDLLERLLIIEGVHGIQMGENPRLLALCLGAMLGEKYLPEVSEEDFFKFRVIETPKGKLTWPECESFEDKLSRHSSGDLYHLFEAVGISMLASALIGCGTTMLNWIRNSLSIRNFERICADMDTMQDVSKDFVLHHQSEILSTLDLLIAREEIMDYEKLGFESSPGSAYFFKNMMSDQN